MTTNLRSADNRLHSLAQEGGAGGTAQRSIKGDFQNAYNGAAAQMNETAKAGESYGLSRFPAPARLLTRRADTRAASRSGGTRRPRWPSKPTMPPRICPTVETQTEAEAAGQTVPILAIARFIVATANGLIRRSMPNSSRTLDG